MRAAGERREQFQNGKRGAVSAGIRAGFIHSANAGEIEPVLAAKEYEAQLDALAAQERRENLRTRFDFAWVGR